MSLLQEIQNDVTNSNVSISNLLRKCKILAYKLGNEDFKAWVEYELNGYPKDQQFLPNYRILKNVYSKGHFSGSFGRALRDADVPTFNLPKEGEFKHEVRQFQKPYDNQQAEQISLMV